MYSPSPFEQLQADAMRALIAGNPRNTLLIMHNLI
jgi:hypothetical protein